MKKQDIINLIRYHFERNENSFRNEVVNFAKYFDSIDDSELAEYLMSFIYESNTLVPQSTDYESKYLKQIFYKNLESLCLPKIIADDIKGIINAVNHNIGINKFLFEGKPGTGKTEAAKHVAKLLNRLLFSVDFENVVDSRLGQTNKNISEVFKEIQSIPSTEKIVVLFDEIDVIALDRLNNNDVREMGRATSMILKELDRLSDLNNRVVIIATTNLYKNLDKALIRRFDASINFDRYTKDDLIEVGENYISVYIKNFQNISKDIRLFKKILKTAPSLPNPGELKNIIKKSLAFSNLDEEFDYLRRLYNSLNINLKENSIQSLKEKGFTLREIEKLTGESKSTVARKLNKE